MEKEKNSNPHNLYDDNNHKRDSSIINERWQETSLSQLSGRQKIFIKALGLTEKVFTNPQTQCKLIIHPKNYETG